MLARHPLLALHGRHAWRHACACESDALAWTWASPWLTHRAPGRMPVCVEPPGQAGSTTEGHLAPGACFFACASRSPLARPRSAYDCDAVSPRDDAQAIPASRRRSRSSFKRCERNARRTKTAGMAPASKSPFGRGLPGELGWARRSPAPAVAVGGGWGRIGHK